MWPTACPTLARTGLLGPHSAPPRTHASPLPRACHGTLTCRVSTLPPFPPSTTSTIRRSGARLALATSGWAGTPASAELRTAQSSAAGGCAQHGTAQGFKVIPLTVKTLRQPAQHGLESPGPLSPPSAACKASKQGGRLRQPARRGAVCPAGRPARPPAAAGQGRRPPLALAPATSTAVGF